MSTEKRKIPPQASGSCPISIPIPVPVPVSALAFLLALSPLPLISLPHLTSLTSHLPCILSCLVLSLPCIPSPSPLISLAPCLHSLTMHLASPVSVLSLTPVLPLLSHPHHPALTPLPPHHHGCSPLCPLGLLSSTHNPFCEPLLAAVLYTPHTHTLPHEQLLASENQVPSVGHRFGMLAWHSMSPSLSLVIFAPLSAVGGISSVPILGFGRVPVTWCNDGSSCGLTCGVSCSRGLSTSLYTFLFPLNGLTSHLEGEEEDPISVVHLMSALKVFVALLVLKIQQLASCQIQLWLF
jgi:hypothetical protein